MCAMKRKRAKEEEEEDDDDDDEDEDEEWEHDEDYDDDDITDLMSHELIENREIFSITHVHVKPQTVPDNP